MYKNKTKFNNKFIKISKLLLITYLKKNAFKYIFLHISVIIIFAILYWISDIFIDKFPNISKKYNLGKSGKLASFSDCIYFSALTQTTVGYEIPQSIHDSGRNNLIYIINILQLFSIIVLIVIAFK